MSPKDVHFETSVQQITDPQHLVEIIRSFPLRYLFIGSGARLQYAKPDQVVNEVMSYLKQDTHQRALIIFGGDTAKNHQPDLGFLVQQVKERLSDSVKVLAVQSWSEYCPFVDYIFKYPRTFCLYSKRELWGGVQDGLPIAATRYYLSDPVQDILTQMICVGGGKIAQQELAYVINKGVLSYHYIAAEVRHQTDDSIYGPTHDWLHAYVEKH